MDPHKAPLFAPFLGTTLSINMKSISRVSVHLCNPKRPQHTHLHRMKISAPSLSRESPEKVLFHTERKKPQNLSTNRLYYLSTIKEVGFSFLLSITWPSRKLLVFSGYLWTFFPLCFSNVDTTLHLPSECPKVNHLNFMDTIKKIQGIYRSWYILCPPFFFITFNFAS